MPRTSFNCRSETSPPSRYQTSFMSRVSSAVATGTASLASPSTMSLISRRENCDWRNGMRDIVLGDALESGRSFNLIHFASSYKFDIFPLSSDPFHQSQFSRREMRDIVLGDARLAVPVATAEDTLLMKLVWY